MAGSVSPDRGLTLSLHHFGQPVMTAHDLDVLFDAAADGAVAPTGSSGRAGWTSGRSSKCCGPARTAAASALDEESDAGLREGLDTSVAYLQAAFPA